jgi:hypothetical protein
MISAAKQRFFISAKGLWRTALKTTDSRRSPGGPMSSSADKWQDRYTTKYWDLIW